MGLSYGTLGGIAAAIAGVNSELDKRRAEEIENRKLKLLEDRGAREDQRQDRQAEQWMIMNTPTGAKLDPTTVDRRRSLGLSEFMEPREAQPAGLASIGPVVGDPWGKMSLPSPTMILPQEAGMYSRPTETERTRIAESKEASYRDRQVIAQNNRMAILQERNKLAQDKLIVESQIRQAEKQADPLQQANLQRILRGIQMDEETLADRLRRTDEEIRQNDERNRQRAEALRLQAMGRGTLNLADIFSRAENPNAAPAPAVTSNYAPTPRPGAGPSILPWEPDAKKRVIGQYYLMPNGRDSGKWAGNGFE